MAYTPHVLVAFGGSWGFSTSEIWECTLRGGLVTGGPDPTDFDGDAYLGSVQGGLATWFGDTANHMSSLARLKWIKANAVGADGKYINPVTHVFDYSTAVSGSAVPGNLPGFCSLAYTWETGRARGTAHRGRMYTPNAFPLDTEFTVSPANGALNAQAGVALLEILDNSGSGISTQELTFGIYSRIDASHHDITGCSSDDTWDVQRRRKDRIPSVRSAVFPYAHP